MKRRHFLGLLGAAGVTMGTGVSAQAASSADVTIACGGAAVQPGDIIYGDRDGVIVIPPFLLEEVAREAAAQEVEDAWVAEQVAGGAAVDGLFPMNAEWRTRHDAARAEQKTQG